MPLFPRRLRARSELGKHSSTRNNQQQDQKEEDQQQQHERTSNSPLHSSAPPSLTPDETTNTASTTISQTGNSSSSSNGNWKQSFRRFVRHPRQSLQHGNASTTRKHSDTPTLEVPVPATPDTVQSSASSLSPPSPSLPEYHAYVVEEQDPLVQAALFQSTGMTTTRNQDNDNNTTDTPTTTIPEEDLHNQVTKAVEALDKAGNDLFAQGEYEQAYQRYERALLLKRSALLYNQDNNGQETTTTNNGPTLSNELDKADTVSGQQPQPDQRASVVASMATSINNMTYIRQRAGLATTEETMASYLKSLQMKRSILGPDHLSVGKTLNNIGSVFYLKKEYEAALSAYKDAHRIMATNLGESHGDVGTVVSNIGDVYFAMNQKSQALDHYRQALNIRWTILGPGDPKVARLMNQIAGLETGEQPVKAIDDQSDSEDEAFGDDEQHRSSIFKEDVNTLQRELQEDMQFFDLVERQMAVDMVKDKMRIFREMRDLYNEDEPKKSLHKETEWKSPRRTNDVIKPETGKVVPSMSPLIENATESEQVPSQQTAEEPEDRRKIAEIEVEVSKAEAQSLEVQALDEPKHDTEDEVPEEPAEMESGDADVSLSETPIETESSKSIDETVVVTSDVPTPATERVEENVTLEHTDSPAEPRCDDVPTLTETPKPGGEPVAATAANSERPVMSRPIIAVDDALSQGRETRLKALASVRSRLAALRADRSTALEEIRSRTNNHTQPIERKSYMYPTQSSMAKAAQMKRLAKANERAANTNGTPDMRRFSAHGSVTDSNSTTGTTGAGATLPNRRMSTGSVISQSADDQTESQATSTQEQQRVPIAQTG